MPLILTINTAIGLLQAGISTIGQLVQAVKDAKAAIHEPDGEVIEADQLAARIAEVQAHGAAAGDAAAGRVEARQADAHLGGVD